jgi:hypothetical protein
LDSPAAWTSRNMTTEPEMSRQTPDRKAGVLSGHGFVASERAGASQLQVLILMLMLMFAIRPQPK